MLVMAWLLSAVASLPQVSKRASDAGDGVAAERIGQSASGKRARLMLVMAWLLSAVASLPQVSERV